MYNKIKNNKYLADRYENYTPQIDSTKFLYGIGMVITGITLIYAITKNIKEITKNMNEIIDIFRENC